MNKIFFLLAGAILLVNSGCSESKKTAKTETGAQADTNSIAVSETSVKIVPAVELKQDPADFLPKGFVIFEKIWGDLDKDGAKDLVLIIKGTDKSNFVVDEYRGELDRNRRGIIVLFNRKHGFEQVVKNVSCFSSENEDGGVYYAPELWIELTKGNLYIRYSHGRYGYWSYTFRYNKKDDFELIGFDSSDNHGPIINRETSINFLTKRQLERVNVNENIEESGDEVFKETWKDIPLKQPIRLSEVKDFDELYFDY
jgi:hypothetical protein